MSSKIRLVAGLGNPGSQHAADRHNAGFWLLDELARRAGSSFHAESKFFGEICEVSLAGSRLRLLKPQTYMNRSGLSVAALAHFFKFEVDEILIVHDEIDIPSGELRVKQGGGHGGHNGLRDIIQHLSSLGFARVRIGVGHPGQKDHVKDFVLHAPGRDEEALIRTSIDKALDYLPKLVDGHFAEAMNALHRRTHREQVEGDKQDGG